MSLAVAERVDRVPKSARKIIVLEDIDSDGRADKSTVFADGLLVPHSVVPGHGGAFVTQSTDLLFLRDRDGDLKADEERVLFTGFGNADVHHMIHGLRWGPGGDLYFLQSIYIALIMFTPLMGRIGSDVMPDIVIAVLVTAGLIVSIGHHVSLSILGCTFCTLLV